MVCGKRSDKLITKLIDVFESAEMLGAEQDVPEGSRYVQISETAVMEILGILRTMQATSQMKRGETLIEINSEGLESEAELEAFLQKVLEKIQAKVT